MKQAGKPPAAPLSEAEMERLEALLWERAVPHGGMPMEMLDGYFCALACGPELVPPSEYNRLIWGDPPPVWESVQEASEGFYLIQGYWNHIVDRLARDPDADPEAVVPAIMMPEELLEHLDTLIESGQVPEAMDAKTRDFPLASGWALGFYLGVELREEAWDAWAEEYDHIAEHLNDIQRLMDVPPPYDDEDGEDDAVAADNADDTPGAEVEFGGLVDDDDFDSDDEEAPPPPDLIERFDIMFELPHILRAFDTLRRTEMIRAQGPARREAGPARNDPCPCGSGRKFKKCHGDPQRLN